MAVYGTNLDINVIGNAIQELQKVKSNYEALKHETGTNIKINAEDKASGVAKKARDSIGRVPKSHNTRFTASGVAAVQARMHNMGEGMDHIHNAGQKVSGILNTIKVVGVAAFTALSGSVLKGAKDVADLQSSYKTTENLVRTGGESAKEAINAVNQMQKDGQRYSLEYGVSQQKIADAYQDLVKRGHTSAQALGVMKSELQASVASGDDFADVVKVSSQTIESFGMKANTTGAMVKNTRLVVNDLAMAADATATNFSDLGVGMEYVGATAHQAGISLRDTSAAMGILSNNGLEADKAGTGLRKAIQSIVSPSAAGKEALSQLGLSTQDFQTKAGKLKDLPDIFKTLKKHMDGLSKTQQVDLMHKLFGTTGQQAGLILANNANKLDELEGKLKKAEKDNYVADLAKRNSQTVKMQMAQAQQSVNAVLMSLGVAFMPAVTKASQALAKGLSSKEAQENIQALSKRMGEFGDAVGKYLVAHGKDLWDIADSLGKIGLAIGQGAVDAINAFSLPFRLFSNDKTASATSGIANSLSAIAKLTPLFKDLGKIWVTYFVASKVMATSKAVSELYKGMLLVTSLGSKKSATGSLLGDIANKRHGGSLTQSALKDATKSAEPAGEEAGNKFVSGMSKKMMAAGKIGSMKLLWQSSRAQAEVEGRRTGTVFLERLGTSIHGEKSLAFGKSVGTKLASGISYAIGAVDILRGLTGKNIKNRAQMVGKGVGTIAGTALGMALTPVLGPFGPIVGSMLGGAIGGKLGPGVAKAFKGALNFFRDLLKGDWSDAFGGIAKGFKSMWRGVTGWAKDTWKKVKDWWNGDDSSSSKKGSSSNRKKQPSTKAVKSLGGNHYSKTDIANVKAMNAAITAYTGSLKKLKSSINHNDPTKQLNGMNKRLTTATKKWDKLAKPLDKVSKAFTNFRQSTLSMAKSVGKLTGKNGVGTFQRDLTKLDRSMKSNKLGQRFKKLAEDIKKSGIVKQMLLLSKTMRQSLTSFKKIASPMKVLSTSMQLLAKSVKQFGTKKDGLVNLQKDIDKLDKTTKKSKFGNQLAGQLQIANKAMSGKHSFVSQFHDLTQTVIKDLRSFKKSFDRDWKSAWKNLDKDASNGLKDVDRAVDNRLDDVIDTEHNFIKSFNSGWNDWLDDLKKAFRDAFDKLPGYAESAMKGIIGRLNKGISGINSVIGSFGGDKKLSSISYAVGTARQGVSGHPGGLAMINDGNGPHKQEIVWQPSKGYQLYSGVNRIVDLEAGSKVFPGELSHSVLSAKGIPHYADGNLSDNEMSKLAEQFEKNATSASKDLMLRFTNWAGAAIYPSFGKATAIGLSRGIANVLKDLIGTEENPGGSGVERWRPYILRAFRRLGIAPAGWKVEKLLRQIQTESGGNPLAFQHGYTDANSGGNEARGLLQFAKSTWEADALPGHTDWRKGFNEILAAIAVLERGGEGGWGNVGNGHGWANGGHVLQAATALVGEDGDEYIINPNKPNALRLIREAMRDVAKRNPNKVHAEPTLSRISYQPANRPDSFERNRQSNDLVDLFHQVINAINGIELRPVMAVDQAAPVFNKYNAKNYGMMRRR